MSFQPFWLGRGDLVTDSTGAVLSMLMLDTISVALFPARSVTSPVTEIPNPSPGGTAKEEQYATPDRKSEQVKLTIAVLLTHPFELGDKMRKPTMIRAVKSMFTFVWDVVTEFPALSVQNPCTN